MKDTVDQAAGFGMLRFGSHRADPAGALYARPSYVWDSALAAKHGPVYLYRDLGKRLMDILFVLVTLPFSLGIIAICAIALWLEGGNPFYTQPRLGEGGKRFSILKLRTMVRNADEVLETYLASDPAMRQEWDELQKLRNDPRVTRIGHLLRKTSLDELPQLFNVLIGDMSLVGPRPMMPEQLEMYGDPKHYNAVKPGITGLWQVSARNNSRFTYRNEVDGSYERSLTLKLDLLILFKTIGVVLRPTGH
ncbi:Bacterial sugar transferase [Sulfitobacter noctilucicola]|uniref:Lipopolysaccharide/colanic/teichoic acid biosynthesis glycosyltransferase n=1 Tax=Sulfitobacter noctilucicola TaxID=1342301 RepID=A0A7W6M945_9RHOB|nr:sugar transferase [Sulfitobacter noctilucicola]KIN64477.1 Bacterial sugar transferase [Sulfitobacter noctilucicola]MBB4174363.1 lipopolysaccharide/colanic/teichoic acid biosynthesis glycosyltransferase [Sulfitobacter noctilucicola]